MKIRKFIEISQEIEVDVTVDDLRQIHLESPEMLHSSLALINDFAGCLKSIPDSIIEKMSYEQRKIIGKFLDDQSCRYLNTPSARRAAINRALQDGDQ